jgi:CRISPR/Cas system-associated exonuclease Cas4 (RecB family)
MRSLSKSKLLAFRQCPKRLWLEIHRADLVEWSDQAQASFLVGHEVGEIARKLYDPKGKGVVFDPKVEGYDEVVIRTDELIETPRPLFEAGFNAGGARAYVDVLLPLRRRGQKVWRMVEVKSSTGVKDTHKDDVAIQAYIARTSGVKLDSVALAHIDSQWVYPGGGDYQGLLKEVDLTEEAFGREEEVQGWIAAAQTIARKRKEPDIGVGSHCSEPYPCGFIDYCQRDVVADEYPVSLLPGNKNNKLRNLIEVDGVSDLRHVPDELLNPKQLRVKTHTLAGSVYFNADGTATALAQHKLPALFLDFETINLAVPIWKGTRPFQQVPFQFSLHRLSRTGKLTQKEFIDLSGQDPSRKFAEALIAACGERGPIFVYSAFESSRISELAKRFPRLARPLLAINERLVDLLPIASDHYYHPEQQGKWSIKNVLPTIAPDLRYDDLEGVQNGGMAMMAYREAVHPDTAGARKARIEQQLLGYCRLDTKAMVRVWQHFAGRADFRL